MLRLRERLDQSLGRRAAATHDSVHRYHFDGIPQIGDRQEDPSPVIGSSVRLRSDIVASDHNYRGGRNFRDLMNSMFRVAEVAPGS